MTAARGRAADTAPEVPGGPELAALAASVLDWRAIGAEAGAEEAQAARPVLDAARLAYVDRDGEVQTWQAGPALIVWRESYSALPLAHGVTDLLTERTLKIGRSPDWTAARIAAGAAWPAVERALGLHEEVKPAKGSLRALVRAGEQGQARAVLACLAVPQIRRAT